MTSIMRLDHERNTITTECVCLFVCFFKYKIKVYMFLFVLCDIQEPSVKCKPNEVKKIKNNFPWGNSLYVVVCTFK